jgi:hypothetical protein
MQHMRSGVMTFCLFMLSASVRADITVKTYNEVMTSKETHEVELGKTYIKGLGVGIEWANTMAKLRKSPLFCPPDTLSLGLKDYIDILDRQIEKYSRLVNQAELQKMWVGSALMHGMEATFPCRGK